MVASVPGGVAIGVASALVAVSAGVKLLCASLGVMSLYVMSGPLEGDLLV
jgi:hypothetical protein